MTETVWAKAVLVNRLDRVAVSIVPMIWFAVGLLEHGSKRNCRRKVTEKHERRQCADGGTMCTLALIGRYDTHIL